MVSIRWFFGVSLKGSCGVLEVFMVLLDAEGLSRDPGGAEMGSKRCKALYRIFGEPTKTDGSVVEGKGSHELARNITDSRCINSKSHSCHHFGNWGPQLWSRAGMDYGGTLGGAGIPTLNLPYINPRVYPTSTSKIPYINPTSALYKP